jgi:hypothetical protein
MDPGLDQTQERKPGPKRVSTGRTSTATPGPIAALCEQGSGTAAHDNPLRRSWMTALATLEIASRASDDRIVGPHFHGM